MLKAAFVTEHTVGHVRFEQLLREAVALDGQIHADWFPLSFEPQGAFESLPPFRSNWSLRASARARRVLRRHGAHWDVILFHTQTASLLSASQMRRIPTVLSVDATPRNIDQVATGYEHAVGHPLIEAGKARIVGRAFRAAAAVVAWSDWVRQSLVDDYRVSPSRVRVVPSGTRVPPSPPSRQDSERLRMLFVGGHFERKGGPYLLEALEAVRFPFEMTVVTHSPVPDRPWLTVYRDVQPGTPRLDALYAAADVFVLPTTADASPHVIIEAMAAGLPVVSTRVGAVPEMVLHGETGLLVEPGDRDELLSALRLLASSDLRRVMGARAHARAAEHFDAAKNARRLLSVLREVGSPEARSRGPISL